MALNLQNLHENYHLQIFDYLSLIDLLNLRTLCRSLNNDFLRHCQSRRTLYLAINNDDTIWEEEVFYRSLNHDIVNFISSTFPNLNVLYIRLCRVNAYSNLTERLGNLLVELGNRVETLTLQISYDLPASGNAQQREPYPVLVIHVNTLLAALNQMTALRELNFYLSDRMISRAVHYDLPILAHLKVFRFYSYCRYYALHDSLLQYAVPNRNLVELDIDWTRYEDKAERQLIYDLDESLTRKFVSIGSMKMPHSNINWNGHMSGLDLFDMAPKFTNLVEVTLNLHSSASYINLVTVFTLLSRNMHKLKHLRLSVNFLLMKNESFVDADYIQLPGVERLFLGIEKINSHDDITLYIKPHISFPNVKIVETIYSHRHKCNLCVYENVDDMLNCHTLLERPLRAIPNLEHLVNH